MKKFFAVIVLAVAVATSAFAQPKAIGIRGGYSGGEASYQHYLGSPNFIEVNAGLDFVGHLGGKVSALYNFTFAQPNWTSRGDWAWYAGAGVTTGVVYSNCKVKGETVEVKRGFEKGFMIGVPVQVGLSYTFWFPLQLSLDLRPSIGVHMHKDSVSNGEVVVKDNKVHTNFYKQGIFGAIPTLSVHYAF